MNRTKQVSRRKEFKKTVDAEDMRRRRGTATNLLRKNKREESLMKRRQALSSAANNGPSAITMPTSDDLAKLTSKESLDNIMKKLNSGDPTQALSATTDIRRMLSIERDPPIDIVLGIGALPNLIEFLKCHDEQPQLALEAAWAITNIASGTSAHTNAVVDCGGIPVFVQLLACENEPLRDQCVWALGNIAGDGADLRDQCLDADVMTALLYQYQTNPSDGLLRNTTWAVSNLCRGKPAPEFDAVRECLEVLPHLLLHHDQDTKIDAAWALSYLTDGPDEKIQAVIDSQVCPELVRMLEDSDKKVQTPALRAVGNIVTGCASQTQTIIDLKPFPAFAKLLQSDKRTLVKETCWTISNITAGEPHQIQAAIDSGILDLVADKMLVGEYDVKKEACWALSNATTGGSHEQIREFVNDNTIQAFVNMLNNREAKTKLISLEALENILLAGEPTSKSKLDDENLFLDCFEEVGGVEMLTSLQEDRNRAIYDRVIAILDHFFDAEEDDEGNENINPNAGANGTFAFGINNNDDSGYGF